MTTQSYFVVHAWVSKSEVERVPRPYTISLQGLILVGGSCAYAIVSVEGEDGYWSLDLTGVEFGSPINDLPNTSGRFNWIGTDHEPSLHLNKEHTRWFDNLEACIMATCMRYDAGWTTP